MSFSPAAIVGEIEKLSYVRSLGIEGWDLSALTPNRRKFLSRVAKKSTNQALQRTVPSRRYRHIEPLPKGTINQELITNA